MAFLFLAIRAPWLTLESILNAIRRGDLRCFAPNMKSVGEERSYTGKNLDQMAASDSGSTSPNVSGLPPTETVPRESDARRRRPH
jgi:hypothetical protein